MSATSRPSPLGGSLSGGLRLSVPLLSLWCWGCAHAVPAASTAVPHAGVPAERVEIALPDPTVAATASAGELRQVGDFVTYRFDGQHLDDPLLVTRRLVSREGERLVVDVTLEEGARRDHFRLRMLESPYGASLISVGRLYRGVQLPFGLEAYHRELERTLPAVDANDGLVEAETVRMQVGHRVVEGLRSTFQVRVGDRLAVMRTVASDAFPWGDLGGDVVAEDGTVLYRAAIVQVGNATIDALMAAHADAEGYQAFDDYE